MIKIDVLIKEKKWKKYIANPKNYLKNQTRKIKNLIPIIKNKKVAFSVLLTGNEQIKNLNKKFRNKNKTTDVLSFPFYKEYELKKKIKKHNDIYLGDVILNYYRVSKRKKKDFIYKFNKLWVHGLLHLIGHKHYLNKDYNKMNRLENKILNKIQNIK